jgi:RHS repeat-associated protein
VLKPSESQGTLTYNALRGSHRRAVQKYTALPLRLFLSVSVTVVLLGLFAATANCESSNPVGPSVQLPANHTVPVHSPPTVGFTLSNNPSTEEIRHVRLFVEPLVPVGAAPSAEENRQLANALHQYVQRSVVDDFSSLEQFVANHPDSPWTPSLLFNLGMECYTAGWYSKALAAYEKAWPLLKSATDPASKALADRAVGELALMYARIGRMNELSTLLASIKGRVLVGPGSDKVNGARQGLWTMQHNPEIAFRCGPLALDRIIAFQHPGKGGQLLIQYSSSTTNGLSLSQVAALSRKAGLNYQMAFRSAGAPLLTPAVVNWKVGHYAALLGEKNGSYLLQDLTFHNEAWVTDRAVESEASGYFLVPPGKLPAGWRTVSEAEGAQIWGKGTTEDSEPNDVTPDDQKTCSGTAAPGMAVHSVFLLDVSLNIQDNPVGYSPPVGPAVRFVVNYNQLESDQPSTFTYSNLGSQWTFNYLAFITDDPFSPDADVNYYTDGGGTQPYTGFNATSQAFAPQIKSHAILTRTSSSSYKMLFPDGSQYIFSQPDSTNTTSRRVFLTQKVDPQGNSAQITYDNQFRVIAVTDAIGQVTVLSYTDSSDPLKITQVTDPFGRFATFTYDISNRLSQITDCIGLASQFAYDSGDNILSMTTPYGTTSFAFGQDGRETWLQTTYPDGENDRVEFSESTTVGTDSQDPASTLPQGMWTRDWVMYGRDTYYWDRNAYSEYLLNPNNFSKAHIYHWLHDPTLTEAMGVLESQKGPLENRVWYNYPGQPPGNYYATIIGTSDRPTAIGRVLDDDTTQLRTFGYNALGYVTNSVDPVGRSMTYVYATNLVDLLEVQQTTGTNNDLDARLQYNSIHRPTAVFDAAGQMTTNTYNARGQLLTTTDPKGETTTLTYTTNGYLLTVVGPLGGTNDTISFTYDAVGRVQTVTNTDGYVLAYNYDNLDRVIKVTYPDGTFDSFTYNKLDLVQAQDRLGRQTLYTYDSLRRRIAAQDPLGRITRFEYCGCGSLSALIDPMGRETSWQHDIEGRVTSKQYADGSLVTYNYENTTSRLKSIVDEKQQLKNYQYYPDDNIQSLSYPNAQNFTPTVTFAYDPNYNRMVSMQDGIGTTTWSYNPVGVLGALMVSSVAGPLTNAIVICQYDQLGRTINRTINGVPQSTTYDVLGRPTTVTNALGAFQYSYVGATARLAAEAYPNGQTNLYTYYNNLGDDRLQQIQHLKPNGSLLSGFGYAYNAVGDITNWVQQLGALTQTWSNGYDAADQLLGVTQAGSNAVNYSYSYDAAANRLFENTNGVQRSFNYNTLNQLLSSSDTGVTNTIYQWDAEQRLVGIIQGTNQSQFFYDGLGRRLRIVETSAGVTQADRRFVWCGSGIDEEHNASGAVVNRYFGQGEQQGGTNLFYARDHLGSVRELTDSLASNRAEYAYAPYGGFTKLQGDLAPNFLFTGHFEHFRSDLLLTLYRAYGPDDARWLSRDPIGERSGVNLYAYGINDPLNEFDLLGDVSVGAQGGPLQISGDDSNPWSGLAGASGLAGNVNDLLRLFLEGMPYLSNYGTLFSSYFNIAGNILNPINIGANAMNTYCDPTIRNILDTGISIGGLYEPFALLSTLEKAGLWGDYYLYSFIFGNDAVDNTLISIGQSWPWQIIDRTLDKRL